MAASPGHVVLGGFLVLAAAVWVGGIVTLIIVAQVTTRTLEPSNRVAFFRALGKMYGIVAGTALAVALGTGAALVYDRFDEGPVVASGVVTAALVLFLAVGIVQARRMTRLRERALHATEDTALAARLRRDAGWAGALRTLIGLLSLALLALGVVIAAS